MRRLTLLTLILSLGLTAWIVCAQAPLSPGALDNLITQDAKALQEILAKDKLDKKSARKGMAAALMIAHYAQSGATKDNAKEMATLRDAALKTLKAIDEDKHAEAKAAAEKLSAKIKADPAAKTDIIPLERTVDFDVIMRQFSSERIGGSGLEKAMEDLVGAKGPFPSADLEKIVVLGHKAAMIATLARGYGPEKDGPKGQTRANWLVFAGEMQKAAHGLAAAAQDKKDIGDAADRLSTTCIKCHDVFR